MWVVAYIYVYVGRMLGQPEEGVPRDWNYSTVLGLKRRSCGGQPSLQPMDFLCFASFAHAWYYCMYWSCVTCRSAEFCRPPNGHVFTVHCQKITWFTEKLLWNSQWFGPGYFHILLSLPCDCCTWYTFYSYLGTWYFIKSVRLRWHCSFQNLWPDVFVVFCQLLSVCFVSVDLLPEFPFDGSHISAEISHLLTHLETAFSFLENIYKWCFEFLLLIAPFSSQDWFLLIAYCSLPPQSLPSVFGIGPHSVG